MATRRRESELYAPLRDYLTAQGYTVRAEVQGCDVTAVKGDELIVIEMKQSLNLRLLVQAAERQRMADSVYLAIPRPNGRLWARQWRGVRRLLRRLELGLMFVAPKSRVRRVEILLHPAPYSHRKHKGARLAVLEEIAGRSGDYNTGGANRRKLVTAYRESAIGIARALRQFGPTSTRELRKLGTGPKTRSILYDNVYGWFQRVDRGVYALTPRGHKELDMYPDVSGLSPTDRPTP